MILAAGRRVKRVLWLMFGILALLAAAVLLRSGPTGDAVARMEETPSPSVLPDVRVKHEFISIPIAAPPRTSLARTQASPPVERKRPKTPIADRGSDVVRTAARQEDASDRRANLLVRAGRAVIGDGKYRPEPFPRIKKH